LWTRVLVIRPISGSSGLRSRDDDDLDGGGGGGGR
jgi:hypothetical protein